MFPMTDFIMKQPDRVEDILGYIETYSVDKNSVHSIDLGSVQEFLGNPSQSLRDGTL